MKLTFELQNGETRNRCDLQWKSVVEKHPRYDCDITYVGVDVTLESPGAFSVSAFVWYTEETRLKFTKTFAKWLADLAAIDVEYYGMVEPQLIATDVNYQVDLRCWWARPGKFDLSIELNSDREDSDWEVAIKGSITREQLDRITTQFRQEIVGVEPLFNDVR